jgi:hypothetical protein
MGGKPRPKKLVTQDVLVDRWIGSAASGCQGHVTFQLPGENPVFGSLDIEGLIDEELPAGSRIRVTVEVLERGPELEGCQNPWPAHRCPEEDGS